MESHISSWKTLFDIIQMGELSDYLKPLQKPDGTESGILIVRNLSCATKKT